MERRATAGAEPGRDARRRSAASGFGTRRIGRVLLVTSDFHYRDDGRILTTSAFMRFVPELRALTRRIEVCAPVHGEGEGAEGYGIEEPPAVTYRPLPPSRTLEQFMRRFPRDGVAIAREIYLGARGADLVWLNGPHPLLPLGAALARLARRPYVLWIRGDILETTRAKYAGTSRMALRTAHYLDRLMKAAARGSVVFYTGTGLERYGAGARHAQLASASLVMEAQLAPAPRNDRREPFRLLWAGQLRPVKGLRYLLEAVRRLRDGGVVVALTIVGDGEQRAELEGEVARLGLWAAVRLIGYIPPGPALAERFREADLYVLPSLSEGVPKALYEAMGHALPVVATRVGGVPGVARDGVSAVLVPPRDPDALAGAIRALRDDPARYRALSRGALDAAGEHTSERETARIGDGLRRAYPHLWSNAE